MKSRHDSGSSAINAAVRLGFGTLGAATTACDDAASTREPTEFRDRWFERGP
jgi:hypothetical protein